MKSDLQIKSDVEAELAWDPMIDAARVGVSVHDAVVALTGTLASHAEKLAVERAAQRVGGVQGVTVDLRVQPAPGFERADADIVKACQHALAWSAKVPQESVKVQVEKGRVTLVGDVEWAYQRDAAEMAVCDLLGVVAVTNLVHVRARPMATDIHAGIRAALERQADRDAQRVDVRVDGSCVMLSGRVRTWADREAALAAAWAAPGVTQVVNEVVVRP